MRKNAIQVVHHICLRSPALIPDAVEIVHNRLADEVNDSCKRNCILMLLDISPELAIKYIHSISDRFASLDETLQCTIAESLKRFKDKRFPEKVTLAGKMLPVY